MSHRLLCLIGALLIATFAISAGAEDDEGTQPLGDTVNEPVPVQEEEAKAEEGEEEEDEGFLGRFSGAFQADFSNAYYFRGILQERDSTVAQPWGEIYFTLFSQEEGWIRDVSIGGGVWASFQSEETGHQDNPKSLYEVDWYPLLSAEFAHGISLLGVYYFYTSPNDAFSTVQELNFKLAWDDSETLGRFALQPWINLAIETKRTSFGPDKGVGLQLGLAPTLYTFDMIQDYPVTFVLPLEIGLALKDYYERDSGSESNFGYLSFGLGASMPLAFMPECMGDWSIGIVGKGYWLNHTLANANLGRNMSPQVIGSIGMEW